MPQRPLFPRHIDSTTDRRTFLKACGTAAGSMVLAPLSGCRQAPPPEPVSRPSHLVQFGHTDLWVSRHCQGTAFRRHLSREGGDVEAHKLIRHCIDLGINFFDSAEGYGMGGSETALGHGVAGRRSEVVIATKGSPHPAGEKPLVFTREILTQKCEASLKRLNTDYIDIYLLHGPDGMTPSSERPEPPPGTATLEHMEMIADTMESLVQAGKIRFWGVSNHLAKQVDELIEIGMRPDRSGKSRIAGLEDYYNIVSGARRDFMTRELFPLIRKGNLGLMAFSPLGEGRLVPGQRARGGVSPGGRDRGTGPGRGRTGGQPPPSVRSLGAFSPRGDQRPLRRRKTRARRGQLQGHPAHPARRGPQAAQGRLRHLQRNDGESEGLRSRGYRLLRGPAERSGRFGPREAIRGRTGAPYSTSGSSG